MAVHRLQPAGEKINFSECLAGVTAFCIFANSKRANVFMTNENEKSDKRDGQSNQKAQHSQSNQNTQSNQTIQSNQNNQNNQSPLPTPFLPRHGHYRHLRVYQVTEMIYDITYYFAHRFLSKGDRTIDQMVQAARSGKQNIAEGNQAAMTSSETEIKLTNVAKASLEELLDDYEDYLRVRGLEHWGKLHPRYQRMREYASGTHIRHSYAQTIRRMTDEEIANLCITLTHQAIYMLHKLLITMQQRFITEGGIREQMLKARLNYRNTQNNQSTQNNQNNQSTQSNQSNQTNA